MISMVIIRNLIFAAQPLTIHPSIQPTGDLKILLLNLRLIRFCVLRVNFLRGCLWKRSTPDWYEHGQPPPLKLLPLFVILMMSPTVNPIGWRGYPWGYEKPKKSGPVGFFAIFRLFINIFTKYPIIILWYRPPIIGYSISCASCVTIKPPISYIFSCSSISSSDRLDNRL